MHNNKIADLSYTPVDSNGGPTPPEANGGPVMGEHDSDMHNDKIADLSYTPVDFNGEPAMGEQVKDVTPEVAGSIGSDTKIDLGGDSDNVVSS